MRSRWRSRRRRNDDHLLLTLLLVVFVLSLPVLGFVLGYSLQPFWGTTGAAWSWPVQVAVGFSSIALLTVGYAACAFDPDRGNLGVQVIRMALGIPLLVLGIVTLGVVMASLPWGRVPLGWYEYGTDQARRAAHWRTVGFSLSVTLPCFVVARRAARKLR